MTPIKTYKDDLSLARSILRRDGQVTHDFLYRKCYPLFKSIYDNYFTDSHDIHEFIDEIYLLIMTPSKETGRCQLENYRGESTLATWVKTVSLFYCYHKYEHKRRIPVIEFAVSGNDDDDGDLGDRLLDNSYSTTMDLSSIGRRDLDAILRSMPNERYRSIIRLRYLEQKTNEETAEALGMSMANYYNKHKLAKEQFTIALRKEFDDV